MNLEDKKRGLAQLLDPPDEREFPDDGAAELPEAPLGNFFGDEFLTLLYRSHDPCSYSLAPIKQHLVDVSTPGRPRHLRAAAAVALGRFVQMRHSDAGNCIGNSTPRDWFYLARQLNSVVGALALANTFLTDRGQRVDFDLEKDPLPRFVQFGERIGRSTPGIHEKVAHAWYLGARLTLRHVQRDFGGWDQESYHCALACIVNYLTLLPPERSLPDDASHVVRRREALIWIKPLWNRLIVAASQQARSPDAYRAALVEQQLAVYLRLDDLEKNPSAANGQPTPARSQLTPGPHQILVVPGVIPSSGDRTEAEYLKQFEALREPLTFKSFPSLNALYRLRATLSAEFPWAQEAILLVMSDLVARRRHGVVRLGMVPTLLVGPPGTGKTRFAQRLSDLLDTPNTVVNMAGMVDVKLLKGVTRGWASNRTSRMVEFILQTKVPNPLFILDEIDKANAGYGNGGDPHEALLDLLEPGNAKRYQDIYLMSECDLSHCLYIATSNSLSALPEPLLSRLRPVLLPPPGPEHAEVILNGIMCDLERSWDLPKGALTVTPRQVALLRGLSPREMRRALLDLLGQDADQVAYTQH